MIRARGLFRQGCQAYIAYVVNIENQEPKLEEDCVVNEFKDIFPDGLLGLPLNREIDFTLDLAQEQQLWLVKEKDVTVRQIYDQVING